MAAIVVLPLVLSPIGFGNLTETIARFARWPVLLIVLLFGLAIFIATARTGGRRDGNGSALAACLQR